MVRLLIQSIDSFYLRLRTKKAFVNFRSIVFKSYLKSITFDLLLTNIFKQFFIASVLETCLPCLIFGRNARRHIAFMYQAYRVSMNSYGI